MTPTKQYSPEYVRQAFAAWFVGEETDDGEQRAFCPICEDPETSTSPSASFKPKEGYFNCLKNHHGLSIYNLAQQLKTERGWNIRSAAMASRHQDVGYKTKIESALTEAGRRTTPLPTPQQISDWNKRLLSGGEALDAFMAKRGVTTDTLMDLEIGWDGYRYTIPIYGADGELVNVRRYKLNAGNANDKMVNIPGHGGAAIYGYDDLKEFDTIVLTEGETDRILLRQTLEGHHIGVVTTTGGAGTFKAEWGRAFLGKTVYVGYDHDEAGVKGAAKALRILGPFATRAYKLEVPLETEHADWTDWLHGAGHSAQDFLALLPEAVLASEKGSETGDGDEEPPLQLTGKRVMLGNTVSEEHQGETLEFVVSVSGRQVEPYAATKDVRLTCSQDKGVPCQSCTLLAHDGEMNVELRKDHPSLFRFVDAGEERRLKILKEVSGIRCTDRVRWHDEHYHTIEELVVQPSVDERPDGESELPVTRTVFSVGTHNSVVNNKVRIVGRNVIDPRTSKVKFVGWVNEPVNLDIDGFKLTPEQMEELKIFQPGDDETPLEKCREISANLGEHVTHIYGRTMLHVAYDLVYHSPLSFKVNDVTMQKGWLEMMVVGDTRTGKSAIAERLIQHYRAGAMVSLEGSSFAGIVGGVQQIDGRWHLTWGVVPMNDRRLVVLDEASGMKDSSLIEQMSSVRSSGIAQITKVATEQTSSRTRLIWITNPIDGSVMLKDNPDVGMAALRGVVPNNEDIARFDFVCAAAKDEVPDAQINSSVAPHHRPDYSSEACEMLVKWVWSLGKDDVIISKAAITAAVKAASDMGRRYVADPPLIQSENARYKILRIAAALAARTFSINELGQLRVNREHVQDAVLFLDEIYESEAMGYARKSRRIVKARSMAEDNREAIVKWLQNDGAPVYDTLVAVGGGTFRQRDFEEFGAMDRDAAKAAVAKLITTKMARRKARGEIAMEPVLISILRDMEDSE